MRNLLHLRTPDRVGEYNSQEEFPLHHYHNTYSTRQTGNTTFVIVRTNTIPSESRTITFESINRQIIPHLLSLNSPTTGATPPADSQLMSGLKTDPTTKTGVSGHLQKTNENNVSDRPAVKIKNAKIFVGTRTDPADEVPLVNTVLKFKIYKNAAIFEDFMDAVSLEEILNLHNTYPFEPYNMSILVIDMLCALEALWKRGLQRNNFGVKDILLVQLPHTNYRQSCYFKLAGIERCTLIDQTWSNDIRALATTLNEVHRMLEGSCDLRDLKSFISQCENPDGMPKYENLLDSFRNHALVTKEIEDGVNRAGLHTCISHFKDHGESRVKDSVGLHLIRSRL